MNKNLSCIRGGRLILEGKVLEGKTLVFSDKILDILDEKTFEGQCTSSGMEFIDASGKYVSPGFIDIHIHGAGGRDTMDGEACDLIGIGEAIAEYGVTGFLPTIMSMEKERIYKAMDSARLACREDHSGAKILGIHMEGPFLSHKYKGAHEAEYFVKPDFTVIENYLDIIKIITMAPEEDDRFEFIRQVKDHSEIVLSMGHTNSDYETAMEAIEAGISSATHLFNAMPPFHHRLPGAVGAVLKSDIPFELIADNIHVHPAIYQILLNAKGKGRMLLVTDAMRAACAGPGNWMLGGQNVIVDDESARLPDGTLAGSILTMDRAVSNILKHTSLAVHEAVALATINPARLIKADAAKGSIKIGKDADLVLFDSEIKVARTISQGKTIFRAVQE